jgi:hypothetical protein
MPIFLNTSTTTTRYELYRYFEIEPPKWVFWHQRKELEAIKRLKQKYIDEGVPPEHVRIVIVSESRRIMP